MKRLIAYLLILAAVGYGAAEIARSFDTNSKTTELMRGRTKRIEEQLGMEPGRE